MMYSLMSSARKENSILQKVWFPSMKLCEALISDRRAAEQLGRVFGEKHPTALGRSPSSEEPEGSPQATSLIETWLISGDGVFHISGAAGSGKTALMSHLHGQAQTKDQLKIWAGDKEVVYCYFQFPKSDSDVQPSVEWLQRTILFKVLQQCPHFTLTVFYPQWRELGQGKWTISHEFPTSSDLYEGLEILTREGVFRYHRFCFFIDGLSECRGSSDELSKLRASIHIWAKGKNVKICTSSRPSVEFDAIAVRSGQTLRLPDTS
jgi:hypothetical protein